MGTRSLEMGFLGRGLVLFLESEFGTGLGGVSYILRGAGVLVGRSPCRRGGHWLSVHREGSGDGSGDVLGLQIPKRSPEWGWETVLGDSGSGGFPPGAFLETCFVEGHLGQNGGLAARAHLGLQDRA